MSLEVALENNDEWLGGQLGNGSKPSKAWADVEIDGTCDCRIVLTNPSQSFFAVAGLTIAAPVILTALYHVFVPTFRYLVHRFSSVVFKPEKNSYSQAHSN
ncbi:hypothetical protein HPP92_009291 [Vanilla planifolia]|uniref:Uncharacterized protein n=1 Tax=Vanilla planifolia TaxID=51239 RepID=A0A835V4K3_VANPL|nr:hypothetical protein HPP92_009291 [Vanilla planifolia]